MTKCGYLSEKTAACKTKAACVNRNFRLSKKLEMNVTIISC